MVILPRASCPSCGDAGLTRIEHLIHGTQIFLSYYCGACEHVWQIPAATTAARPPAKPPPPKRRPR